MAIIQVESLLIDTELQLVKDGMRRYTEQQHAWGGYRPMTITLRDEKQNLLGAALGEGGRGWLKIAIIWVQENHRGQGYGTQLLQVMEAEAVKQTCRHAYLDTFSYQARPFYERFGYEVFGTLEDYPPGHTRFFMRKTLQP
jgi:GNAT superfamily N-acetyltransferase